MSKRYYQILITHISSGAQFYAKENTWTITTDKQQARKFVVPWFRDALACYYRSLYPEDAGFFVETISIREVS